MQSLRIVARLASRAAFRPAPLRSISSFPKNSLIPAWRSSSKPLHAAFSTSARWRESAGDSDQVLSEKLNHERALELETGDPNKPEPTIEEFLQNSPWSVVDQPGTHTVTMTRDFGNEQVKVEFTINDMHELEDDEAAEYDEDSALADEDFESPKRTINQSGTSGGKVDVVSEDSVAPADREGGADEDIAMGASYPMDLLITITKPGDKAIVVRAGARDGTIITEHINYYPKSSLINPANAEDTTEAGSLYAGPPFENLDTDLQMMFENYLEERGVNAELANMIVEYVDWKEQREYVDWLKNMKQFIDA